MEFVRKAEKAMEEPFKALPALPKETKRGLADLWPWLALIIGALQLFVAWRLYDWANRVNELADWANRWAESLGVAGTNAGMTLWVWIGIILLAVDGIILLVAFPKLKKKQRSGWELLFLAALINLAYGIFSLFIDGHGGMGSLLGAVIGSAIGFYLLFQVREYFGGKALGASTKSEAKK